MDFNTDIGNLSGIGKKRRDALRGMGIFTVGDLLYHFPRAYQNRGDILPLAMTPDGSVGAFMLTVATKPQTFMLKNRKQITKFTAFDDTGRCTVTFFNQPFVKDIFNVGDEFRFYGKLSVKYHVRELSSPIYEQVSEHKKLPALCPVYPLTEGITQNIIKASIESCFKSLRDENYCFPEIFSPEMIKKYDLVPLYDALCAIHFPTDEERVKKARDRFVFEELYLFALGLTMSKKNKVSYDNAYPIRNTDYSEFLACLPYSLTKAQARSVEEIVNDMANKEGRPMSRLLSGDVGSGKTVCAALAAYVAVKNKAQVAFMAPTEILAIQHYNDLKPVFEKLGMRVELLTGQTNRAARERIFAEVLNGETDIVVGTHALLNDKLEFRSLGLCITDEQHRFGVRQRGMLTEKSKNDAMQAHVLVMSATPIPRTLALILYGDLDLSVLDELPPNRQIVDTFLVDESYRERLNGFIRKNATSNQVYIVCPMVEESDSGDDLGLVPLFFNERAENVENNNKLVSALELSKRLKNEVFPDLSVGCIHGKLKSAEKERIMRDFADNKIKILVSTTVIEVGVNVPNATLMVIENAERFGLSQLHQLRGRVGRGKDKSYCVLVSGSESDKAKKRLETLCKTNNGYKIAEVDLEMRGPGDFLPDAVGDARQSGSIKFKYASFCDMEMLKKAFECAEGVLKEDSELRHIQNSGMRLYMEKMFLRLRGSIN